MVTDDDFGPDADSYRGFAPVQRAGQRAVQSAVQRFMQSFMQTAVQRSISIRLERAALTAVGPCNGSCLCVTSSLYQ